LEDLTKNEKQQSSPRVRKRHPVADTDPQPQEKSSRGGESELIENAKNGDEKAFEELVNKNRGRMVSLLRKLCRNEADVEDLYQDIVLKLYLKLNMFEGKSSLSTWLYRIVTNTFFMHQRKAANGKISFVPIADSELPHSRADLLCENEAPNPLSRVLNAEMAHFIRDAMSTMPEGHKEVFLLRKLDELSLKEVSDIVKISVPTVKSRQHRARLYLQSRMTGLA